MVTKYEKYIVKNIDLKNIIKQCLDDVNKMIPYKIELFKQHNYFLIKYDLWSLLSIKKDGYNLIVRLANIEDMNKTNIKIINYNDNNININDILKKYILNAYILMYVCKYNKFRLNKLFDLDDDMGDIILKMIFEDRELFIKMLKSKELPYSIQLEYDYLLNAKNFDLI